MEENIRNDEMKIPEHCSKGNEITEGFGKKELLRTLIFSATGLVIGILLMLFWSKQITTIVLSISIFSAGGYIFCKKDRYSRQSILDILLDFKKFSQSQKFYEYRR